MEASAAEEGAHLSLAVVELGGEYFGHRTCGSAGVLQHHSPQPDSLLPRRHHSGCH